MQLQGWFLVISYNLYGFKILTIHHSLRNVSKVNLLKTWLFTFSLGSDLFLNPELLQHRRFLSIYGRQPGLRIHIFQPADENFNPRH